MVDFASFDYQIAEHQYPINNDGTLTSLGTRDAITQEYQNEDYVRDMTIVSDGSIPVVSAESPK